jgi:hypothetical protein
MLARYLEEDERQKESAKEWRGLKAHLAISIFHSSGMGVSVTYIAMTIPRSRKSGPPYS